MTYFSDIAKLFHWLIAALIVSQYGLAKLAEYAEEENRALDQVAILANHKSVGMTILVLALARLIYRFYNAPPILPSDVPKWQKKASSLSHWLLYGFLFALPISGWLMSSAKAFTVSWFNLFAIPDLVSPSESLANQLHSAHHFLSEALFVIALIHIFAALKHHFFDKDDILIRMADGRSWSIFGVTALIAILSLGRFFDSGSSSSSPTTQSSRKLTLSDSNLPAWTIDYSDSFIRFSGDQAGAPFSGLWQDWIANIQFDSEQLSKSRFNVSIKPASAFSNDRDRDDTIRSADFFDVTQFASLYYLAEKFSSVDQDFVANGQLTMKGFSSPAALNFKIVEDKGKQTLTGTAVLDRLVWSIGTGDWLDTSWLGQQVVVEVRVVKENVKQ